MTNTYYSSLSGMLAASYGLQNTSNNVANMQSHGFKRNDVFYSSLGNGHGEEGFGNGVRVGGNRTNFGEGKYLETNSTSDLAVVGQGFFVIRLKSNELIYTRAGDFEFKQGILIDKHSGGQVQGYDRAGNLVPIYEKGPKTSPGKASRDIFLSGNFVPHKIDKKAEDPNTPKPPEPTPEPEKVYENVIFELKNIYDQQGKAHTITFEFKNIPSSIKNDLDLANNWEIENISCNDAEINFPSFQYIKFLDTYDPIVGSNSIQFTLNGKQTVNIHFGVLDQGTGKAVELKNLLGETSQTDIQAYKNDGYADGKQYSFSFDENGQIAYYYDNGQIIEGIHVGLAHFDDMENNLIQTQDNFFRTKSDKGVHYGRPNKLAFGAIKSKQIESSNVDSTAEFANIVVLQRMFQACSQIMDIDKQLLEELESKS